MEGNRAYDEWIRSENKQLTLLEHLEEQIKICTQPGTWDANRAEILTDKYCKILEASLKENNNFGIEELKKRLDELKTQLDNLILDNLV